MSAVDARTVTVAEAKTRVIRAINKNRPLFLWGPPGVGKSELCQGITRTQRSQLGITRPADIKL